MFLASPGESRSVQTEQPAGRPDRQRRGCLPTGLWRSHKPGRGADFGQHGSGDAKQSDNFGVPIQGLQVHQQGTRSIGDVCDMRSTTHAACQVPDDPGIHIAKDGVTARGSFSRAWNVVENPVDFRAGKIGGEGQADFIAEAILAAFFGQFVAEGIGAGILPDDGIVKGLACVAIPNHGRFTLVGDADGGNIGGQEGGFGKRRLQHFLRAFPDFKRIMFDPAGLGKELADVLFDQRRRRCPIDQRPCSVYWWSLGRWMRCIWSR